MGRPKLLAAACVVLALAACAINFALLARRTSPSASGGDEAAATLALPPIETNGTSAGDASVLAIAAMPRDEGATLHRNEAEEEAVSSVANSTSGGAPTTEVRKEGDGNATAPSIASCFQARKDTIPPSLYGKLGLPFINLGFPKMGSTSTHAFFGCAGYHSVHYRCQRRITCAECMFNSDRAGQLPLHQCGRADAYAQLDGRIEGRDQFDNLWFPQIELLEEIVRGYPNATFYIPFRSMEKWHRSLTNWPPGDNMLKISTRLLMANITGLPRFKGANLDELSEFFCAHVERVRRLVPPHRLVEIDTEDPATAARLSDVFDVDEACWGHVNANANLHPGLNATTAGVPWRFRGKRELRGKEGVWRRRQDYVPLVAPGRGGRAKANVTGGMVAGTKANVSNGSPMASMTSNRATIEGLTPGSVWNTTTPWSESCQQLTAHEKGHWQHYAHHDLSPLLSDPSVWQFYYPEEMKWLMGEQLPQNFGKCVPSSKFLATNTLVGHQCGCGVKGFAPTHSVWVHNGTTSNAMAHTNPDDAYYAGSPTLRLARQLAEANATLCFSGDSIDYQIYMAMHNNLRRIDQLHRLHHPGKGGVVRIVTREIPVTHRYHTEPGNVSDWFLHGRRPPNGDGSFLHARRPPPGGFGSMYSILETKAHFDFRDTAQSNATVKRGRIRYYMAYGWSPWNIDLMEDCNVVVMNMALHYSPDGDHMGRETRHTLMNDTLAAITYLANFTASHPNRVAVWRSALPQHFRTRDGHFRGWKTLPKGHSCTAIIKHFHQEYNKEHEAAFARLCKPSQPCGHLQHSCTIDPAANVEYQTLYKFWLDNNCTEHIEREQLRLGNIGESNQGKQQITGTIFRWNVFDLFDVIQWHNKDMDCSHVCYIPALFEAAFERLSMLLSPSLATF